MVRSWALSALYVLLVTQLGGLTSVSRALVRSRADQIGFAYPSPGGGVGYIQRQLPK